MSREDEDVMLFSFILIKFIECEWLYVETYIENLSLLFEKKYVTMICTRDGAAW